MWFCVIGSSGPAWVLGVPGGSQTNLSWVFSPNQTMVKTWFSGCVGSHPRTKLRSKANFCLNIEDDLRERESEY